MHNQSDNYTINRGQLRVPSRDITVTPASERTLGRAERASSDVEAVKVPERSATSQNQR